MATQAHFQTNDVSAAWAVLSAEGSSANALVGGLQQLHAAGARFEVGEPPELFRTVRMTLTKSTFIGSQIPLTLLHKLRRTVRDLSDVQFKVFWLVQLVVVRLRVETVGLTSQDDAVVLVDVAASGVLHGWAISAGLAVDVVSQQND